MLFFFRIFAISLNWSFWVRFFSWDLGEPWAKILPSKKPATTSFWQLNLGSCLIKSFSERSVFFLVAVAISEIKENIVETKRTRAIR